MTDHADQPQPAPELAGQVADVPDTDDPVVLRELLRQAREHLRLRQSIERMLAENTARTEALLLEARAQAAPAMDTEALRSAVAELRTSLQAALAAVDRLERVAGNGTEPRAATPQPEDARPVAGVTSTSAPRTVEVLVHEIHSPALARSLQQHIVALDGVDRAEVRELAEGLLRITVGGTAALDEASLAGWEPERRRTVRATHPGVLEIELSPDGT